ncbi:type 2 lanthipeptide synthetase LanM family protein [Anabaena catenula]|uniref:Type 2 lantipeptide synthetase LanM n=1 Tax=Anabaena catenula FACHB-362 TaxID=2692877 RepID=A0ABR8JCH4_9NOST|nr:type 2 lanthipeptide synthetase LanM family protein [Anabaena catenula]MBD2694681.1 type 2 lantipeptide synthetase LanM [Anabaena catenula FACHB-362]
MIQKIVAFKQQSAVESFLKIIADASFLWERLNVEKFLIDINQLNEQEIDSRLDHWCQTVAQGKWDILQKRLQWDGLDLNTVRQRMGTVQIVALQNLPDWAKTLQQIMQPSADFILTKEIFLAVTPQDPLPFEDVLLRFVWVARQQLLSRFGCIELTKDDFPLSHLTEVAYHSLERSLLQRLAKICYKTLDFEFAQVRPFGSNLLNLLQIKTENNNNKTYYNQFVNQLLQDGLLTFFQKYSVLGRLVATVINFWVDSTAEFIQRLAEDTPNIQRTFGSTHANDKIAEIQTSLSDSHKQGRTVFVLTFESGLKLVYKPKGLGIEVAFNQFLHWCNQHSHLLELKTLKLLNRDTYGWVEYVEHQPCHDEAAALRFYQRAGMLMCVIYALRGTDCHNENVIASGEHLVLVDVETLLHHEPHVLENFYNNQNEDEKIAEQQFLNSVLRTGLLPEWNFSSDRRIAFDISGLGSTTTQQAPQKFPYWQSINTDNMQLQYKYGELPIQKNVPYLGDIALSPIDYQESIVTGFKQMYRFLIAHKDDLIAPDSPLTGMQGQQVRFIFRPTRIYGTILNKTWSPDYLKHGVDYSIELDRLSCAFLSVREKPNPWPILNAELQVMAQLDIPYFTANTSSDELSVGINQEIANYFQQPSYQQSLAQLQAMDEIDLARQVAIIQGAFYAQLAQTSIGQSQTWEAETLPVLNSGQLIAEAEAIANQLESRAIPDPDGSVNWMGLGYVISAERYRLQVLGYSLYEGRCGVALFLSALNQMTKQPRFHDLALRTLQPLRQQIQKLDLESQQRIVRLVGIGGASGLGSMIYSFVKVSQFLGDETLLEDAQALANWITPQLIVADKYLDVVGGAAGCILALLSLYQATGQENVLVKAIACGEHLLTHRYSHEGAPKAWLTLGEKPLTGFSHGAAGIAYALLRLYAVTQEQVYLQAALEGIEYENSIFSSSHGNWPVFPRIELMNKPTSFETVWCHGSGGIGLARLGSLGIVKTSEIERDIEIALQTTQTKGLSVIDHLCCGNMGIVEVLMVGAERCSRSDWHEAALQNATNVVARAKRTGAYQLFANLPNSVFNPSFFQGTAGIGYQLLRLANNNLPSILLWE